MQPQVPDQCTQLLSRMPWGPRQQRSPMPAPGEAGAPDVATTVLHGGAGGAPRARGHYALAELGGRGATRVRGRRRWTEHLQLAVNGDRQVER